MKKATPLNVSILACLTCTLMVSNTMAQGSLTPPGAPAPTMKTLQQIEPRIDLATVAGDASYHHVLNQPGSYYLSGNLAVTKSSGIKISSEGVTLDLNGFSIYSASGSGGNGIAVYNDRATIRNGGIVGFLYGVNYGVTSLRAKAGLLEKLAVSECTTYGIFGGRGMRIVDCRAHDNPGYGFLTAEGASMEGCTAYDNQGYGIMVNKGSSLRNCTVHGNQNYGISAGEGSTLNGCTAYNNQGGGIKVGNGSVIENCTAYGNTGDGIYADYGSLVRGCTARDNVGTGDESYGIYARVNGSVIDCVVRYNTNTNSPSTPQQGCGIYVSAGSVVNCTAIYNQGDGICISQYSRASGNTAHYNGYQGDGAGIHVKYNDSRVDGNTATGNDRGIDVDAGGNLVVRNSASGNTTNYNVATGNDLGTIQTTPVGAGAWDNFEF